MAVRIPRLAYPLIEHIGPVALRLFMHTVRFSFDCAPGAGGVMDERTNVIYVFWHGHMMAPAYMYRHLAVRIMISMARDGEYVARVIRRMGFHAVRGSSSRGAVTALEALARQAREGATVAMTPDGPRGPRHLFQPGAIYVAQLSGAPIIPTAVAIRRSWRARSWDRFEIPKPFTRVHFVVGDPVWVDRDLPRRNAPALAEHLQFMMFDLEKQARSFLGMSSHGQETQV